MTLGPVEVSAIGEEEVRAVARFLHDNLNSRISPESWSGLIVPPWGAKAPNHGFCLRGREGIVGAYVAVYSTRQIRCQQRRLCNLAAFCVLEDYRAHGLRLLRAVLGQKGFVFTDLSPSGNVVSLNERLGFNHLDTATTLAVNLPWLSSRGLRVSSDPVVVQSALTGVDLKVYRDHLAARASHHIVVLGGGGYCYLIARRDRRKGIRLFATPIYVGGNRELLRAAWPKVASHLLVRLGAPLTLAETRVLGFSPPLGTALRVPRPKMYRGNDISDEDIDYAYSELALLEW